MKIYKIPVAWSDKIYEVAIPQIKSDIVPPIKVDNPKITIKKKGAWDGHK